MYCVFEFCVCPRLALTSRLDGFTSMRAVFEGGESLSSRGGWLSDSNGGPRKLKKRVSKRAAVLRNLHVKPVWCIFGFSLEFDSIQLHTRSMGWPREDQDEKRGWVRKSVPCLKAEVMMDGGCSLLRKVTPFLRCTILTFFGGSKTVATPFSASY